MKFLLEIKNRFVLNIFFILYIINIVYYYKICLIYTLINHLILKETLNFYLIYTDTLELFNLFYNIATFIGFLFFMVFFKYHLLVFFKSALTKKECQNINFFFLICTIFLCLAKLVSIKLIPQIWYFFGCFKTNFILNSIHSEIKITQYFLLYYKIFKFNIIFFSLILTIYVNIKLFKKIEVILKLRKIFFIMIVLLIIIFTDQIITQFLLLLIAVSIYELIILLFILYYRIK